MVKYSLMKIIYRSWSLKGKKLPSSLMLYSFVGFTLGLSGQAYPDSQFVHVERSHYQDLYVEDGAQTRCVSFRDQDQQTCIYKERPDYLVW